MKLTDEKNEEKIFRNKSVQLKDRVEFLNKSFEISEDTENPVEKLQFRKIKRNKKNKNLINAIFSYNFWFSLLVISLIVVSVLLNSYFLERLDPVFFKAISNSFSAYKEFLSNPTNFIVDQITKPYVVTVGEYGNAGIAKDEAVKLLPKFKEINIKQLGSGIYTFEMESLSSKKKAYELAEKFIHDGYEAVHVRYLPNQ